MTSCIHHLSSQVQSNKRIRKTDFLQDLTGRFDVDQEGNSLAEALARSWLPARFIFSGVSDLNWRLVFAQPCSSLKHGVNFSVVGQASSGIIGGFVKLSAGERTHWASWPTIMPWNIRNPTQTANTSSAQRQNDGTQWRVAADRLSHLVTCR